MKNWKKLFFSLIIVLSFLVIEVDASAPPPPPGGIDGPGGSDPHVPGGGANIQGGILILIVLGLGYGAKKLYDAKVKVAVEDEE